MGGGHGLSASLRALRLLGDDVADALTAVVTVADDGGSSGRLRTDYDVLPPGDLRMALAALASDDEWGRIWSVLFQHRFTAGELTGHPVGNLVLTGLTQTLGDPVAGLDAACRLLGVRGRVLPSSLLPLLICADVVGLDPLDPGAATSVRGQVEVATTTGRVVQVRLEPAAPPACPQALAALEAADWVVLGPGSLFTSVIPHLLVPQVRAALAATGARVLLPLNLAPQQGETTGFSPEAHLEALLSHVPELRVDVVLADPAAVADTAGLVDAASGLDAEVVLAPVGVDGGAPRHDPVRLAAAYRSIMGA